MLLLFIILVIVGAAAVGLCINYFSLSKPADKGSTVPQVLSGTALIGAFLLAIVLANASSSYSSAQTAAKQEADTIDTLYESANYVDMPYRHTRGRRWNPFGLYTDGLLSVFGQR
jgi:hypothetical protein